MEGSPVNGMEVFRSSNQVTSLILTFCGALMGVFGYLCIRYVEVGGDWFVTLVIASELVLGVLILLLGLCSMFAVTSLAFDRPKRLVHWSQRRPFSRKMRSCSFDEIEHILIRRCQVGKAVGYVEASLVPTTGDPIVLAIGRKDRRESPLSLARRISDLTGIEVHRRDQGHEVA